MSGRKGPRSGGPRPRRSFTPAQKLDLLTRYEQAVEAGGGVIDGRRLLNAGEGGRAPGN